MRTWPPNLIDCLPRRYVRFSWKVWLSRLKCALNDSPIAPYGASVMAGNPRLSARAAKSAGRPRALLISTPKECDWRGVVNLAKAEVALGGRWGRGAQA